MTRPATRALALVGALLLVCALPARAQTTYAVTVAAKTDAHPYFGQGHPQAYLIGGSEAPFLSLVRGQTYLFRMSGVSPVHPFYLSTSPEGAGQGVWADGVEGNFASGENTLTFTVPAGAPDELWYQCSSHDRMGWRMQIASATTTATFTAALDGGSEVPANASRASGSVSATLDGNRLTVSGSFRGLESAFNTAVGAHLHGGLAGQNGPVLFPLAVALDADGRGGSFGEAANTFTLTADQVAALNGRALYANVHSANLPAGEIRGQLVPAGGTVLRAALSGRAEVPANGSQALGGVAVELRGGQAVVSGAFSGLQTDFNTAVGAHLHLGAVGANGPVVFPLVTAVGADGRSGTFAASANTFALTAEQTAAFEAGQYYVNVHTAGRPAGELRGQVVPLRVRVIEAWLTGGNEVPAVPTPALGGLVGLLDGTTLTVAGSFFGLQSDFNEAVGAHLHLGAATENGPVVFPLAVTLDADRRGGTVGAAANTLVLTETQAERFLTGRYYANVHSVDRPAGEVRGQVLVSANVAPNAPAITAPASGATVALGGDPATPVAVTWAGGDRNGNAVHYTWELARDEAFTDVVFQAATGTLARFDTRAGAVDTLLAGLGVAPGASASLFHRARATDGSFRAAGTPAAITFQRAGAVSTEPGGDGGFALGAAFPNPGGTSVSLALTLPEAAEVTVEVFDALGRRVLALAPATLLAGPHTLALDTAALPSGTYLYRVRAEGGARSYEASGRLSRVQ